MRFGLAGAISGAVAVAAGAFGAHALKHQLSAARFELWETAVRYQLVHALALLGVSWWLERGPRPALAAGGWAFLAGAALFSGSLYALALGAPRTVGLATPFGGLALIAGWVALAASLRRRP
jgi:uncharacterized membrane protein YgdD (TMEM256/DUF423 family)